MEARPNTRKGFMSDIFSSFKVGDTLLSNRIVMAPMTRSRAPEDIATEQTALYYSQRATAGLIVSEGTPISREGRAICSTPVSTPPRRLPAGSSPRTLFTVLAVKFMRNCGTLVAYRIRQFNRIISNQSVRQRNPHPVRRHSVTRTAVSRDSWILQFPGRCLQKMWCA